MENKFYVYAHIRPDTGAVFYVGKGRGKRARLMVRRSEYHTRIVAKLARSGLRPEIRIVRDGLTEVCAFALERALIYIFRSRGVKLANLTDGGEGMSGLKMPREGVEKRRKNQIGKKLAEETKKKISEKAKGRTMPSHVKEALRLANTGRKRTPEQIEATASSIRGKKKPPHVIEAMRISSTGRVKSLETREKLSKSLRGKKKPKSWCDYLSKRQQIPVFCLTNKTTYPSGKIAATELGLCISSVTAVCKGRLRQTGGYIFRYANGRE